MARPFWALSMHPFGASMAELDNPQAACTIACAIAAVISQIGIWRLPLLRETTT